MAWYMNTDGFFSVVQNEDDHSTLLVRARRREDLERLNERLEKPHPIREWEGAAYPYRIILKKKFWADYLVIMAMEIDYRIFTSTIPAGDYLKETAYHEIYFSLMKLEEEG